MYLPAYSSSPQGPVSSARQYVNFTYVLPLNTTHIPLIQCVHLTANTCVCAGPYYALLNVRDASHDQIMNNAEITYIKQILGLRHGQQYDTAKTLRYGHIMIMTDQDHDGSHIKGLLINFLHAHFPSLLKIPGFLVEFITPNIKASKGKKTEVFYTMPEYDNFKEANDGSTRGWTIKYYKARLPALRVRRRWRV